jgi:hypothetical protein
LRKSVLLCATFAALLVPSLASAATPGINVSQFSQLQAAKATGAKLARIFVIYPTAGAAAPSSDDYIQLDQVIQGYTDAGIKPIVDISGKGAPPRSVTDYASYVGNIAQRYGDKLAAIEVWNEEDEAIWWGKSGGDPATYAAILKATYAQVGGKVPVVLGGMTGNNYTFLDQVYSALGGNSQGAFDAVGVHTDTACSLVGPDSFYRNPDGRISQFSFLGLREVHAIMDAHGDAAKKIWMTEIGWNTSAQTCDSGMFAGKKAGGVSPALQATYLGEAYHCLKSYDFVQNALWFNLQDFDGDTPETRYGLTNTDGSPKPSYQAFQDVLAGKDDFAGQGCGDFDPPSITVAEPTEGGLFFDVLPITASASDPSGVGRISLAADGKLIRNFTTGQADPSTFPKTLNATIDWQGGKLLGLGPHTITVTALDGNGNSTTKTVHVTKVALSSLKNLPVKFKTFKLSGKGTTRTLKVQVTGATSKTVGFRAVHKVNVVFQKLVKGKWKTAHKYTKTAKAPFTLKVKLQKAKWRVQAVFPAKAPFKGAKTPYLTFKV